MFLLLGKRDRDRDRVDRHGVLSFSCVMLCMRTDGPLKSTDHTKQCSPCLNSLSLHSLSLSQSLSLSRNRRSSLVSGIAKIFEEICGKVRFAL